MVLHDFKVAEAVAALEKENAPMLMQLRDLERQVKTCTVEVDNLVIKTFADTGEKTLLGGLVKLQERNTVPTYDRSARGEIWAWVKANYPNTFVPNWDVVTDIITADSDPNCPVRPYIKLLPLKRDYSKLAEQLLTEVPEEAGTHTPMPE